MGKGWRDDRKIRDGANKEKGGGEFCPALHPTPGLIIFVLVFCDRPFLHSPKKHFR